MSFTVKKSLQLVKDGTGCKNEFSNAIKSFFGNIPITAMFVWSLAHMKTRIDKVAKTLFSFSFILNYLKL